MASSSNQATMLSFEEAKEVPMAKMRQIPIPPFHGNTQFSSNNGVAGDVNDGNMDNQNRSRSRNPSGTNRNTHVSGNNGGIADMMEDNVDDRFHHQSRTPSGSNKRGRKENKANEIGESLKMLAKNAKAKLEDKTKYSIFECLELLDSMGTHIGRATYVKAMKVLQDKGWRETFIKMSEDRRNDWIDSIEDGEF
ncbi:hypothetical protein MKW98_006872 [Papaver atlanticum]|uniref:Uncharacterized protein n=1 Tax=Papaver atlanticum TaxID=357466 RepID=A0AAD4SU85_9MAGN|nr:hypothetical protein MKW98_006872 [Papaver atlanticum]